MANDRKNIRGYPDISFIDNISFSDLQEQMIQDFEERYQELTGKEVTLAAADPLRMILYGTAKFKEKDKKSNTMEEQSI